MQPKQPKTTKWLVQAQPTATSNANYPNELRMQPNATRSNTWLVQAQPTATHNVSYSNELRMQPDATKNNKMASASATYCNS